MKLTVKDVRSARATVQALLKRSGFPIQKSRGRLKDQRLEGVQVATQGAAVTVASFDTAEIKRAAQTLLDAGLELWSFVDKRYFTTPDDTLLKNGVFAVKVSSVMSKQAKRPDFKPDLTRVFREDFPAVVRDSVFQRVVAAFAHGLGGTTRDGVVRIPYAPYDFTVLYNKWYDPSGPMVAFMIYPAKKGNRSKMYKSFSGLVQDSKKLMIQFAAWLNMIKVAILKREGADVSGIQSRLRGMKFASAMVTAIKQLEARPNDMPKAASVLKEASADEKALKWLEARAKKGKGAFVPETMARAFELLGAPWKIESTVAITSKISTWKAQSFLGGSGLFGDRDYHISEKSSKKDKWRFRGPAAAQEDDKIISELRAHTQEFSGSAPSSPRVGQFYISRPSIQKGPYGGRAQWVADDLFCGTPGWKVTTPKGSFTVGVPVSAGGKPQEKGPAYKIPSVWTPLYKAGIQEAATEAMQGSEMVGRAQKKVEQSKPRQEYSKVVEGLLESLTARKATEAAIFWEAQMQRDAKLYKKALKEAADSGKPPPDSHHVKGLRGSITNSYFYNWVLVQIEGTDRLYTRVPYPEFDKDIMKGAEQRAKMFQEEFVRKNTDKLSAIVNHKGSKLTQHEVKRINPGPTDFGGELVFAFEDGSGFTVRNKTVWKTSQNGQEFTQYPTTFHKVKMSDGTALKGPSEKKMVEIFARS